MKDELILQRSHSVIPEVLNRESRVFKPSGFRVKPGMTAKHSGTKERNKSHFFILHPSSIILQTGFTLLEIMISLAVIGGLLVTLLYSIQYHLGIAERHEVLTVSTILAKNKMAEMEKNPSTATGEFPGPYSGYRFATGVRESPYPGISEIFVVVTKDRENVRLSELVQTKK